MEEKKDGNGCIIAFVVIFAIIALIFCIQMIKDSYFSKSVNTGKTIDDKEIIRFAEKEVKQKLRYPETAKFQKEEIIGKKGNVSVVRLYSVSDDKNHEEGRVKFVIGIENNNGELKMVNIATNEDTCHIDVAEEFEKLIEEKKYEEIYDNLFSTTLKNKLLKSDFISYDLDLAESNTVANPSVDNNNYLESVTTVTRDKNGQLWLMKIKNGMIYEFDNI